MMKYKTLAVLLIGLICGALLAMSGLVKAKESESSSSIEAQATLGTALSYQGRLNDGGSPANGAYDFQFKLYDSATGGTQIGSTLTQSDVQVDNGVFTVFLDFGDVFNGEQRYLEVGVRPGSVGGSFTVLTPRQTLAPVPYALWAKNTGSGGGGGTEVWRLSPDVATDYTTGDGSLISAGYYYPSDHFYGQNIVNGFAPPTVEKTIQSIKLLIIRRTGSYANSFTLTFEVRDFAGNIQHTVSTSAIDLKTTPTQVWISVPLSAIPDALVISPGEYLAIHGIIGGTPGGDMQVYPAFEVEVQ